MIKNVAYFPSQCAQNSGPVMSAVLDYFQASGIETQENSWGSDAAVIWSVLWAGRMASNQAVYTHYRSQGKPVIVLEIGALYRGRTWRVAVNHITRDGYYGHEQDLDWDRPRKLGISKAITFGANPQILIAAQHADSLQVAGINMTNWVVDKIAHIRRHTDRPIVVRPHPRSRLNLSAMPSGITVQHPRPVPNTYDNFDMHFNCHAVVNHNSGPGIQAAISGVRPVVDSTSLAWPVAVPLENIDCVYDCDRSLWLTQICHTEYTLEELQKGLWLKRIEPALQ